MSRTTPTAVGHELPKYALLGMRQAGALPPLALGEPQLDALLTDARTQPAGADLCRRATVLALTLALAAPLPPVAHRPLPPPPADPRRALPLAGVAVLEHACNQGDLDAVMALLREVDAAGWSLPATFLVTLPEFNPQHRWRHLLRDLRSPLLQWLAAQHPDWGWLLDTTGGHEAGSAPDFDLAAGAARVAAMRALRAADPDTARERLIAAWPSCAPEERAALLPALEQGLSLADASWLDQVLDDRRKEVRAAARALLLALPESGLRQRARARLLPLWSRDPATGTLEIELPAAHDKSMQRDGIEPKPPTGKGERAWWLEQLLGQVTLCELGGALGVDAETVIDGIAARKDHHALLWAQAQGLFQRNDLAEQQAWVAALPRHPAVAVVLLQLAEVSRLLAAPWARSLLLPYLAAADRKALGMFLHTLVAGSPAPWDAEFAETVLGAVRRLHDDPRDGKQIARAVRMEALLKIPARPALFDAWSAFDDQGASRRDQTLLENRLYWRRALAEHLTPPSP